MGSSYFGEPNFGNERASGSSSSSRKGKKNTSSEKPKQPQRGLGVAQLEKIRLHGQMPCAYHPSLHAPYSSNFNNEDPRVQIAYSSMMPSSSFSYSSSSTSSYSYGIQPNIMMGLSEYQTTNIRYGGSQQTNTARWEAANVILESQSYAPSNITRPFLNLNDSQDIKGHRNGSVGSSSHNSESSDTQELDLELRLSL
ncbi:Protein SPEAR1, partial [Mucuna pruriens]